MSDKTSSAEQVAERLGRAKIGSAVGVGLTAVSNAVVAGLFPASWYDDMDRLGRDTGVEVPRSVFRWSHKRASIKSKSTKRGNASPPRQGDSGNVAAQ